MLQARTGQIVQWLNERCVGRVVHVDDAAFVGPATDSERNRPGAGVQLFMQSLDRMLATEVLIDHIDTLRFVGPLSWMRIWGRSFKSR